MVCVKICNKFTEDGAVAARDGLFGLGVGTISFQNVNCIGSEENFTQCANDVQASTSCTHFQDAGVDCLGRPLRKLAMLACLYMHLYVYMCVCVCVCVCVYTVCACHCVHGCYVWV